MRRDDWVPFDVVNAISTDRPSGIARVSGDVNMRRDLEVKAREDRKQSGAADWLAYGWYNSSLLCTASL